MGLICGTFAIFREKRKLLVLRYIKLINRNLELAGKPLGKGLPANEANPRPGKGESLSPYDFSCAPEHRAINFQGRPSTLFVNTT